jgi:putative cardiolipin synthase
MPKHDATVHEPRPRRALYCWASLLVTVGLSACMSLPNVADRAWESALLPAQHGPLVQLAANSLEAGHSGMRLIGSGSEALQARLALIEGATRSLDLQVYQFKADASGRALMRALRDAAARGVRVRVLVDDLYTAGDDGPWLALAAQPGVQLRMFNPFLAGRESQVGRLLEAAFGSERMHHRMHNKMIVADGVLALAGGRNIADAYFLPLPQGNFVDIDVLVAGASLSSMSLAFDLYWNSAYSHSLHSILNAGLSDPPSPASWTGALDRPCASVACDDVERVRREPTPLASEFVLGRLVMRRAQTLVAVDSPEKVENDEVAADLGMLARTGSQVRLLVAQAIQQVRSELLIVSPYLIPGPTGVAGVSTMRRRDVQMTLLTNSLAATDEPLVHLSYSKYRAALLREGVTLYEWAPAGGTRVLRELVAGAPVLRLHAKAALIDRELVFLGSMNFDPRSRDVNTEFGLLVRSPELAEDLHTLLMQLIDEGAYRLHLQSDGHSLRWTRGDGSIISEGEEPDTDPVSRVLLRLLGPLVPEELL